MPYEATFWAEGFGLVTDRFGHAVDDQCGRKGMTAVPKNTVCLWFDGGAEPAARFYADTFPDSHVTAVHRAPADYPGGKAGDVLMVTFTVAGIPCLGLNGGPHAQHSEAFPSRSPPTPRKKPTAIGRPSWATVGRRRNAAGASTAGGCAGKSSRVC